MQVSAEWNNTYIPFRNDVCIHQLFQIQAAENPSAECLVFNGATMTYAQLDQKTNQLACHLQALGVNRDVPVAVLMERSFDIIIAVMGELSVIPYCTQRKNPCTSLGGVAAMKLQHVPLYPQLQNTLSIQHKCNG